MKIHIIFQGQLATFSPTDPFLNILSNIKVSFQNPLPTNFVLFDPETQKIFNEASYNGLATSTKQEINLFIKDISDIPESEAEETPKESHNDETSYIIKLEPVLVAIQEAWKQKKLKINEDLDKLITVQVQCTIGDHLRQMREKVKKLSTKFIPKLPDRIEEEKIALNESPERVIEKPVPVIEKPVEKKIEKIVDEIIEKEILTPVSPNTNPITNTKSPKTDIDLKKRTTSQCWSFREEIIDLFRRDQLFIVEGPKGIGKSTQIPEFVLDELKGGQYSIPYLINL